MSPAARLLLIGGALWVLLRASKKRAGAGNAVVLSVARAIPDGGVYQISGTGVPFDVVHQGALILAKGPTVYCSGFTFAVCMEAARARGLLRSKSVQDVRAFQRNWYGAGGESEELSGPALEKLGIGRRVSHAEAAPGDFMQFWRTSGNGHSTVFLDWLKEGGRRVGVRYRSAQSDGVGDKTERFSDSGGRVVRSRTYFSRLS